MCRDKESSRPLRVALGTVHPYDEARIRGGVEASALALARALAAHEDIDLHVVAAHRDVVRPHTERRGRATFHWLPTGPRLHALREATVEARRARAVYRRLQPDIIHAQDPSAFAVGAPSGVPVLLTVHGLELLAVSMRRLPPYRGLAGRYRRLATEWTLRRSLRRADGLVSVGGEYVARTLGPLLAADTPIYAIANPVDNDFFEIADLSANAPLIVLCPAEINSNKNQLGLVRAFAAARLAVPGAQLVLAGGVGEPLYRERLDREIRRLGLEQDVSLPGHLGQAALLRAYGNAAVVALASLQEMAPMALAQAQAAGRPVVATRVGGVDWIVSDRVTGLLAASGDEDELARHLGHLLADARAREAMAAAGRAAAHQRFRGTSVAEQTVAAYRDIVSLGSKKERSEVRLAGRGLIS